MDHLEFLTELNYWMTLIYGFGKLIFDIAIIVIPLMIFLEVMKDLRVLDRLTGWFSWLTKPYKLPTAAVFPILVGLVFGIAYGGSLIIQAAKDGTLTRRDMYLVNLFLVINHSIIEDTLLFVAIGAKGILLILIRFLAAILITLIVSRYYKGEVNNTQVLSG